MRTYIPEIGESIKETIEGAFMLSFNKGENTTFTFNGLSMVVDASYGTIEDYVKDWEELCKKRSEEYRASDQYKAAEEKRVQLVKNHQEALNEILEMLPSIHGQGLLAFVKWLKEFSVHTDHVGVIYDKNFVLNELDQLGYEANEYVGWKGAYSLEVSVKYITGQIINCLNTVGLIPPIAVTMCNKVLENKPL